MSYEIIYDKQFVRAEKDGKEVFYPFILQGSNNCYMYSSSGREVRERSWFLCTFHLEYGTIEDFKQALDNYEKELFERYQKSDEPYTSERFSYFTALEFFGQRKLTFDMYRNMYINGCKKALTLEQLREHGVCIHLHSYSFGDGAENFKASGKEEFNVYPKTSAEFVEQLNYYREYVKGHKDVHLHVGLSASKESMQRVRREFFPTKRNYGRSKEAVEVDKFYAVRDTKNDNYIYKLKRYGYSYSAYGSDVCKKFLTDKQAEKWRKRIIEKLGNHFEVVEIYKKETLYV